ncbi:MAG TPA: DNA primase [Gammaproteobacteria bacterium]|nr:DNA primase [Gammaproteobacteria bacterium]
MAGRIPQQFIDELISRTDIVELIDERVALKKAGKEFVACCPFHDEKTPSFTVSPAKQFYHCFGCGAHGTALGFLMDYDHLQFTEAVEELASRAGMEVPVESVPGAAQEREDSRPLYAILEQAASWFGQQLRQPRAQEAVEYLKRRGLSGKTAATFGMGFAPPGWDNLLQALGNSEERIGLLQKAGLAIKKEGGGSYDRFRNRIMFPIRDARGRVIGFGGRVLGDDTPKYLNSPETPLFHKGRELYGLYEARKAVRNLERILVVEGYMDVISLAQHGIHYAVATLGTATTQEHVARLFRLVPELVFCFDGDRAGREAAVRAMENVAPLLREGRQISFLFLPEGEDPDSQVRSEGRERFEARISNSVTFSEFFFQHLTDQTDITTMEGRARLVELARPLLRRMPPGLLREMMLARLKELSRVPTVKLGSGGKNTTKKQQRGKNHVKTPSPIRTAVSLLLQSPEMAGLAGDPQRFQAIGAPGAGLLVELLELLQANPGLNTAALLERWRDREEGRHLARLAQWKPPFGDQGSLEAEFRGAIERLDHQYVEQRTEELLQRARCGLLGDEEKSELQRLLSRGRNQR